MNIPMLDQMKKFFPKYKFVGVATACDKPFEELTDKDFIGELVIIGYRPDLGIELVAEESRWFSPTPGIPCSRFSEECRYPRAVHFARFTSPQGPLAVFCSHYDDFSLDARKCAVRVESEFIYECVQEGDFVISMRDGNFYPDNITEQNPKGDGQVLIDELVASTGLRVVKAVDPYHYGNTGTWIGWETDKFCSPRHGERLDDKTRIYDLILSNRSPLWTIHHPGMFTFDGLVSLGSEDFSTGRLCASDHCGVFAAF